MENIIARLFEDLRGVCSLVFKYIFPEGPGVGIYVVGLCILLFLFYIFKSGPKHAAKISLMVLAALCFLLFAIHSLGKIFHIGLSF